MWGGGIIASLSISCVVFMPNMLFSQWYFSPTKTPSSGYLVHANKVGIGDSFKISYTPRTTLHLHNFLRLIR